MKIRGKVIFILICVGIPLVINIVVIANLPLKEERLKSLDDFISRLNRPEKINEIIVFDWRKSIKIHDKKIIKEICEGAKILYNENWRLAYEGSYRDHYLIKFKMDDGYYNFYYDKNIEYDDGCKKEFLNNADNTFVENPYNDCGQLSLLNEPNYEAIERDAGCVDCKVVLINIDLIPVLRKYVDPLLK